MENLNHYLRYRLRLLLEHSRKGVRSLTNILLVVVSLTAVVLLIIEVGYQLTPIVVKNFLQFYKIALIILAIGGVINYLLNNPNLSKLSKVSKSIFYLHFFVSTLIIIFYLIGEKSLKLTSWGSFLFKIQLPYIILFILSFSQISAAILRFLNSKFIPARLFTLSFLFFIFIGSWLLILPNSLLKPISYLDALFTATSAVCITGLTVINIGETFTNTGLFFLLLLIQIGGLGVISFTTFFGLLALGKTSIRTDVLIKDMLSQNNFNEIFNLLRLIFLTTIAIEIIGAFWLYQTVNDASIFPFRSAVFHSISAFCNAGFSTLPDGFVTPFLIHNYHFLFAISVLVILGSIGFPILNNLRSGIYVKFSNYIHRILSKKTRNHVVNLFSLNTKIAVTMTIFLLLVGTGIFLLTEQKSILLNQPWYGKVTTSFFMAVTPRSGGFNCYEMGKMTQLAILITVGLMWIGGGPLSTGGGIKTTTFGLLVITIWNIMKRQDYIEVSHRRIAPISVMRASALVFISVVISGICIILISHFDPEISLRNIIFEVISAISTCGLSMDTTPLLSHSSQVILMILMFCGRVGLLIILESLIRGQRQTIYRYPTDYVAVG